MTAKYELFGEKKQISGAQTKGRDIIANIRTGLFSSS
jgi:hypothetical protein